jgi:hypothetical protein
MKRTFTRLIGYALLVLFLGSADLAQAQSTVTFNVDVTSGYHSISKTFTLSGNRLGVIMRDDNGSSVYLWIFNSAGTRTTNIDITSRFDWQHNYHGGVNITAVTLKNGNIFIATNPNTNSAGIVSYQGRYIILNDAGVSQYSGQLNSVNAGANYIFGIQLQVLSDGKIMALWRRDGHTVTTRLFNENGTPFNNDVTIAGPGTAFPWISIYDISTAAGKNGNYIITLFGWLGELHSYVFTNNGVNANFNAAGSIIMDPIVYNNYGIFGTAALTNGNFAIVYTVANGNYVKIVSNTGATVADKTPIAISNGMAVLPCNSAGSEGFYVAEQDWGGYPWTTTSVKRFNLSGSLQATINLPEGSVIEGQYEFVAGAAGGFAYTYQYYRDVAYDEMMDEFMPDGDLDWRGGMIGFSMSTLPVSLVKYEVKLTADQKALLTWTTTTEVNNSHFEIEKSTDGRQFVSIGRVAGKFITGTGADYSFTDGETISRTTYYRLKQFDIDGKSKDLGTKLLHVNKGITKAGVYPNPVQGSNITLVAGDEPIPAAYRITDALGKVLISGALRQSQENVDVSKLKEGIYFVQIGKQVIKIRK